MESILDFKKTDPWDYKAAEKTVELLNLKARSFICLAGTGDPNGSEFNLAVGTLYGFSYALRMSYKGPDAPTGAGPYTVGVLQARWSLIPGAVSFDPAKKDNLAWSVMIRQPDFLDQPLFERFCKEAAWKAEKKKTPTAWYNKLRLEKEGSGRFAQILHLGSYDDEPATFQILEEKLWAQGLTRKNKEHVEIYLSDPRRTKLEKLKTILRVELKV